MWRLASKSNDAPEAWRQRKAQGIEEEERSLELVSRRGTDEAKGLGIDVSSSG